MLSTLRLLARSLLICCAITIQAYAQSYDGTYSGTIACDPIPGVTAGPLKTVFTLRVAGDVITYEREVIRPTGEAPLGMTETGRGSITAERELILTGTAKGRTFRIDATYEENLPATPFASPGHRSGPTRTGPHPTRGHAPSS